MGVNGSHHRSVYRRVYRWDHALVNRVANFNFALLHMLDQIAGSNVQYCILFATRTPYADQIGLYYGCTKPTGRVCKYR
jgi:hypothetical protein